MAHALARAHGIACGALGLGGLKDKALRAVGADVIGHALLGKLAGQGFDGLAGKAVRTGLTRGAIRTAESPGVALRYAKIANASNGLADGGDAVQVTLARPAKVERRWHAAEQNVWRCREFPACPAHGAVRGGVAHLGADAIVAGGDAEAGQALAVVHARKAAFSRLCVDEVAAGVVDDFAGLSVLPAREFGQRADIGIEFKRIAAVIARNVSAPEVGGPQVRGAAVLRRRASIDRGCPATAATTDDNGQKCQRSHAPIAPALPDHGPPACPCAVDRPVCWSVAIVYEPAKFRTWGCPACNWRICCVKTPFHRRQAWQRGRRRLRRAQKAIA